MKKRNISIILASLLTLSCILSGCSSSLTETDSETEMTQTVAFEMEQIYEITHFKLYRNTVTDVLYLWRWSGDKGGFTEMSDPETGLPLTYERYKELCETKKKTY